MRGGEPLEALRHRPAGALRLCERIEEAIERPVLAEEEDVVLAAEVVVQIARRQPGGIRDVPHAGSREAARAEDAGGGVQDAHAPGVGAAAQALSTRRPAD